MYTLQTKIHAIRNPFPHCLLQIEGNEGAGLRREDQDDALADIGHEAYESKIGERAQFSKECPSAKD